MKKCKQCNQNFSDEVTFCPKCGRKLEETEEVKYFCSKCGQQIEAGAKFCPKCGTPNESMAMYDNSNMVDNPQYAADNSIRKSSGSTKSNDTLQCLKEKYLSFSGRLNRKPYIIRSLIVGVIMTVLFVVIDVLFEDEFTFDEFGMLTTTPGTAEILFTLFVAVIGMVCMISLSVRRLHDLEKSGWFILLNYVPLINIALGIYMVFFRGTDGNNQYGNDPLSGK